MSSRGRERRLVAKEGLESSRFVAINTKETICWSQWEKKEDRSTRCRGMKRKEDITRCRGMKEDKGATCRRVKRKRTTYRPTVYVLSEINIYRMRMDQLFVFNTNTISSVAVPL